MERLSYRPRRRADRQNLIGINVNIFGRFPSRKLLDTEGLSYTIASANGCIVSQVSTDYYVFDHSKSSCNQLMADADVAYVKNNGMKGMFADDTVPIYNSTVPAGWEQGMVSFIHLLHQELNSNGLYLLANANAYSDPSLGSTDDGTADLNWAKQIAPDGIMEESWDETRDGQLFQLRASGNAWTQDWDSWQNMAKSVMSAGMDFVGLNYSKPSGTYPNWTNYGANDTQYVPYAWSSTLMAETSRPRRIYAGAC